MPVSLWHTYLDYKKLAAGDGEDVLVTLENRIHLTYEQWKKQIRKKFREKIIPGKIYTPQEKQKMVSDFLRGLYQDWEKYVLHESILFHKRKMKKSLLNCFRKSPTLQERIQKRILKDILSEDVAMRLCEEHVIAHPGFYSEEWND